MRVLCLHDSAVRFSGFAQKALTGITYAKINVNSHTRSKTPWLVVFHTQFLPPVNLAPRARNAGIGLRAAQAALKLVLWGSCSFAEGLKCDDGRTVGEHTRDA